MSTLPPQIWPRILFVGRVDNAGLANRISRGLNAHAGERISRVWTLERNPFRFQEDLVGPPLDCEAEPPAGLFTWLRKELDWVITTGDGDYELLPQLFDALQSLGGGAKYFAATHSGSLYRENAKMYNEADFQLCAKVRFVGYDSMHLVNELEDPEHDTPTFPYWATHEPAQLVIVPPDLGFKLKVSHSPSNRSKKGTETILPVLEKLQAEGLIDVDLIEGVPAGEACARRGLSHVYIDQMNPEIGGFGCAAIEAMAVGCVTLADVRHANPGVNYKEIPPIVNVQTAESLEFSLRQFAADAALRERARQQSLEWVHNHATPERVGKRFLEILTQHAG